MAQSTGRPSQVAMIGMIAIGVTVAISSFGIVRAERPVPASTGTFDCSSGTACVTGSSTGSKTWGVYGVSNSADGVHGITNATNGNSAVAGIANGKSGFSNGVYGRSSNGDGVDGVSTNKAPGVYGVSSSGSGVYADSTGANTYALAAYAEDESGYIATLSNLATDATCSIDPNANLNCSGTIKGADVEVQRVTSSGQHVLAHGSESTSATIEDFGTARMVGGVANVYLERDFASTIDRNSPYYVFLTPLGDQRGLYVSIKGSNGFQVRENEHGRDTLAFDYRIVAHPLDAKNDRLPIAPAVRRPPKPMR